MIKNLVIVESPTKAKTIQNYLNINDFQVVSTFGHISDLPKNNLGIDIKNNFDPKYIIINNKKEIVNYLRKLVNKSKLIWLATDEDREGEAISWHLYKELNIPDNKLNRIVFHEITKNSIINAIKNPRLINYNLVNAQQARRILDRLVGFNISPILWRKIKTGLSAGRVQSIAVRLIVEREKEINNFTCIYYYKVIIFLISKKGYEIKAELNQKINSKIEIKRLLNKCINEQFQINKIEIKKNKKKPLPPFTTSSLQQEAYKILNYSVAKTMYLAQELYEEGYITYTRTDSVHLSNEIISKIKEEINQLYGKEYFFYRKYINKIKSAQEAHEAIRPTNIKIIKIITKNIHKYKLYTLIWKRTIASQMSDAILKKILINIKSTISSFHFIYKKEIIDFDGFLKIYNNEEEKNEEEKKNILLLNNKDFLERKKILAIQTFKNPPSRYSEASLVKKLEELGIGRPSTYAPIIYTIQKRNYIEIKKYENIKKDYEIISLLEKTISSIKKEEVIKNNKNKIFPTDIGILVNDFLLKYFDKILDYGFTAKIEKDFDEIANGNKEWKKIIKSFYKDFSSILEYVSSNVERVQSKRFLGIDPISGEKVWARIGKFGSLIQIGEVVNNKKPKFASLLKNQNINSISLKDALKNFELPKKIGLYENIEILINIGRYGPYIKYGNNFFSIKKIDDPFNITLNQAIDIIRIKIEENKKNIIKSFKYLDSYIEILKGKYGPYIKYCKKNYKISKNIEPINLTLEDCKIIISK